MRRQRRYFLMTGIVILLAVVLAAGRASQAAGSVAGAAAPQDPAPVGYLTGPQAGQPLDIALEYVHQHAAELGLTKADLADVIVRDQYTSQHNGLTHLYLRQRLDAIEIYLADIAVHVTTDGRILALHNDFVPNLAERVDGPAAPVLTAAEAVEAAAISLDLDLTRPLQTLERSNEPDRATRFSNGGISLENIPARLVYQPLADGTVRLAWDLAIYPLDAQHYWSLRVDAASGDVLAQVDWVVSEQWGESGAEPAGSEAISAPPGQTPSGQSPDDPTAPDQYQVYAEPAESPNHASPLPPGDGRTTVVSPADSLASPYGWHDTDGAAGSEYTITRGNNAHAYEDATLPTNNVGFSPDGGPTLEFSFALDLTQPPSAYQSAAITNLFYWNNLMHDVWYQYGFDEASGNFQQNNYGRGGLGNDYVLAEAQDVGGTNNANFATPTDGSRPRMQMYIWTAPNPDKDGDLDNGVIAHEYGHGISNRLTGGPSTVSCLNNSEQMGEGWSDWFALMMTMEAGDTGPDRRGIGTYVLNQPTTGTGIRAYPYSTNMAIDPRTYDDIQTAVIPHGVGSVWAAMIWEVTWALADAYGFDPDLHNGTGGNNMAMQLVMDGLKLQPCSPGFVDGRNAILQADLVNYGGANQCLIWNAFAKRGLGYSALQGSSGSITDGSEAFDLPPACLLLADGLPANQSVCLGDPAQYSLWVGSGFTAPVTMTVSSQPVTSTVTFSPNPVNPDPALTFLTVSDTAGAATGTYTMTITANGGLTDTLPLVLNLLSPSPAAPTLASPADQAAGVSVAPTLSWNAVPGGASYTVEVATDPAFSNIVATASGLPTPSYTTPVLSPQTLYYWRVRVASSCGTGPDSPARSFFTGSLSCSAAASTDVPKTISASGTPSVGSVINIPASDTVLDVNILNLAGTHTYISDLDFNLQSPADTSVQIMAPSCGSSDNFDLDLDDEAAGAPGGWPCPPVGGGTYRPSNPLSAFDGQDSAGTWTLTIDDNFNLDGGSLNSWSLEICTADAPTADYSDLASSYGVAWHTGDGSLHLGASWSADASFAVDGDDDNDGGLSRTGSWTPGSSANLILNVSGVDGDDYVACWLDWDDDAQFTASEKLFLPGAPVNGNNNLTFTVPGTYDPTANPILDGRCRLYELEPTTEGTEAPTGGAAGGEVQDMRFQFSPTAITLANSQAGPARSSTLVLILALGLLLTTASLWTFRRNRFLTR